MKTGKQISLPKRAWIHIYESIRHEPYGTQDWIPIWNIRVPNYFFQTEPSDKKVITYAQRFIKRGFIDKPLSVHTNPNYEDSDIVFLDDEYIRWLLCKTNNQLRHGNVPVRYSDKNRKGSNI